ncbi:MAG: CCA tRNA nucleotidyltransferase [Spirochaetes bacterium]|nr:CCA tRNA nucleotidyltransferase [Spirochaetota bacterium]MBU1080220.1 CCA tRNA nucleotidyltransferase [Spirochaetota bacterium]
MLVRYQNGPDGKPVKKAIVYTEREHGIEPSAVDPDAVRIVERLRSGGHSAYIVGGAVRDLILGRSPKDYDIVTDAEPPRIKKLFYRSRIIGKRFRLVHVYMGPRIYEVSTFRSIANGTVGNTYGTIDEDARRRDFTMNALYFDPLERKLVDYVGGLKDMRAGRIVPVIPLKTIFAEDPVRMIRAVKYAEATGFTIPFMTRMAIKRHAPLLAGASVSRLGEEATKILYSGNAGKIIDSLRRFGLLSPILPGVEARLSGPTAPSMRAALSDLDAYVAETGDKTLGALLSFIVKDAVAAAQAIPEEDVQASFKNALEAARDFLAPLTMPRVEVEAAVRAVFKAPDPKQKPKRPRRRRRRKAPSGSGDQATRGGPEDAPRDGD